MRRLVQLTIMIVMVGLPTLTVAQRVEVDEFRVSKWVTENRSAMKIPSVATGIVGPNENYYLQIYGPAELDEPFLIGSLSKSVTAMAVMLLVHDGKLSLDDPVKDWLSPAPADVEIRHLLYQTSGLDRHQGIPAWSDTEASLEDVAADSMWGEAGGEFSYSNMNYEILGHVVQAVARQSYGDFVRTRIFEPVGMKDSSAAPVAMSGHVTGHQYMFGFPVGLGEPDYAVRSVPAGFVWMSAHDMARWLRLFVARGELDGEQVIPETVIETLLTPPEKTPYAMGWALTGDPPVASHTGSTAAFSASMAVVPDREFGVFVLTNVNSWLGTAPTTIRDGLLSSLMEEPRKETILNLEFVIRLAIGLALGLYLLLAFAALIRWARAGLPLRIRGMPRWRITFTLLLLAGVVALMNFFLRTNPFILVETQPDIGVTFLLVLIVEPLRQLMNAWRRTAEKDLLEPTSEDDQ